MTGVFQGGIIAASLGFVALAWWRSLRRGELPYAARRPVPWESMGGAFLATFFIVLQLAVFFAPAPLAEAAAPAMTDEDFITASLLSVQWLVLSGVVMSVLRSTGNARLADFGLGALAERWRSDVVLGGATALFLFGPVYLVHIATTLIIKQGSQNGVLLHLAESTNPLVFAAAFFAAVIVAPIFEEFVFRSLLQGWLEKVEDQLLGWRRVRDQQPLWDEPPQSVGAGEPAPSTAVADNDNPFAPSLAGDRPRQSLANELDEFPPTTLNAAGLPHGWVPVLISGLAFALVHLEAGPDPIPLFLFGVIIGYVYQRTHRLLACIVCHAIFNAVSLSLAWIETAGG